MTTLKYMQSQFCQFWWIRSQTCLEICVCPLGFFLKKLFSFILVQLTCAFALTALSSAIFVHLSPSVAWRRHDARPLGYFSFAIAKMLSTNKPKARKIYMEPDAAPRMSPFPKRRAKDNIGAITLHTGPVYKHWLRIHSRHRLWRCNWGQRLYCKFFRSKRRRDRRWS